MLQIRHIIEAVLLLARGLWELMSTRQEMAAFEKGMRRLMEQVGGQLLSQLLEAMDDRLMAERDRDCQVVHYKSRRIITRFGEMTIRRRLYRHRKTGETRFLLDERLGIPPRERWSPLLKQRAVELATTLSYDEAATALGWVAPGVSKQAIWLSSSSSVSRIEAKESAPIRSRGRAVMADRSTSARALTDNNTYRPYRRLRCPPRRPRDTLKIIAVRRLVTRSPGLKATRGSSTN